MIKTGAEHLQSLRDGRRVHIDGTLVKDVTVDPAFRRSVASVCGLYDAQHRPELRATLTYAPADGDGAANRMWQMPTSYDELVGRRQALEQWSALHAGFLGRSPDHVASCITGMAMAPEVFGPERGAALAAYYRYARDNDLYLTYVIINPQANRALSAGEQQTDDLVAGIVDQDAAGLTIRGAKMLSTAGIMANEVLVTTIQPLKPGEERYAVSFAIPMNAPGLQILSRKSYEAASDNVFDSPLSSRYDENDAVLYFDDVRVPWDRVFVAGDVRLCLAQFHDTPAHVYQNYQAQIRLMVKLRFLAGIAHRIAEVNGILGFPQVREMLGQIAAEVGMVEGLVAGMEAKGGHRGAYYLPDRHTLYTAQVLTQQLYPKITTAIRELAGGGMIMQPSSARDFASPELAALIGKTQQSPAASAEEKVKFYRLAWDAIGSEFASRHLQYEMFYAGAAFVTKGHSFRCFDWQRSAAMVDGFLAGYDLDGVLAEKSKGAKGVAA
ncbi:MAG: 4-hydroxyphenylacetate 3-hydroxylase N-terminal domain-containing protein [Alphaproteobacteria bacterium]